MRLLILNWRDLEHPRAGGSEVYAQNLAKHWAAAGHEVTFFCSRPPGLAPNQEHDGYSIVRRGGRLSVYREARNFYEQAEPNRFDAILDVVNTRPFMTPRWHTAHTRVVALVHQVAREVWRYEVPPPLHVLGRYVLEPRWLAAYRRSTVLTVSESSRRSLLDYGLTNVRVVHEGVDPPLDRALPPKQDRPTMIFVGRLSKNKRPDHALEAHALVRRDLSDAQLWIIGEGPMTDHLRRLAGPGVTFFGRVDPARKQDLVASAHVLVATSVREGWGLVVSEAAQIGTPAVAYDVAGLRDSVPAAGGRLTAPEPASLATALVDCLSNPTGPDLARSDCGVLSWAAVAEEILPFLAGELASPHAPRRSGRPELPPPSVARGCGPTSGPGS